ncbi:MAG: DUF1080 domain-containing protein [Planctomycetota bacterium]|nr:MAG: DUF1080 domain-containing protein [Planctomycetota bacterium]
MHPEPPMGREAFWGNWALRMPDGAAGWLSLWEEQGQPDGELWTVGSPKQLRKVHFQGETLLFERMLRIGPPEFPGGPPTGPRVACLHKAQVAGAAMTIELVTPATQTRPASSTIFHGKRLPPLPPRPDLTRVRFGAPQRLFNGRNLDGWTLTNPAQINGWKAENGELVNATPKLDFQPYSRYGNLRTIAEFTDFNLQIEFNVPAGGNSGIYLRGMYEAQVVDRDSRMQGIQGVGAIFGRIAPSENAGLPGGNWQHYDLTLVQRHATVVLNGKKVIDNQPIAGCTNGALTADETLPGPIYLQGDHTAVRYRNILLRPVVG